MTIAPALSDRVLAELTDALGDAVVERASEHRRRVDDALFGLGPERYEAMLDLVLTLRRPMLAKDLDPRGLSQTLSRGLRPLDDELLEQVARSFDDLEAVQRDLDRLAAADDRAEQHVEARAVMDRQGQQPLPGVAGRQPPLTGGGRVPQGVRGEQHLLGDAGGPGGRDDEREPGDLGGAHHRADVVLG